MTTDSIGTLVKRLARPHASGGVAIERSVILAEGAASAQILTWISEHDGVAESSMPAARSSGLHGPRGDVRTPQQPGPPRRFVLPLRAFD
jgi:hypothetical protein